MQVLTFPSPQTPLWKSCETFTLLMTVARITLTARLGCGYQPQEIGLLLVRVHLLVNIKDFGLMQRVLDRELSSQVEVGEIII